MDDSKTTRESTPGLRVDFPGHGVAVVLGGSGGIGKVVCERLAQCGCDVALTYRGNVENARAVAATVNRLGRRAHTQSLDITDAAAVQAYYQAIAEQYGRIHTLVVATGADIRMDYLINVEVDEWRNTIVNDLVGFFNAVKMVLPHLRAGGGGSIVALSSAAMVRHSPMDILSTGPKGGIDAVVRAVAREEGRYKIRANSVGLGAIDTGLMDRLWEHLPPRAAEAMRHGVPLRRIGKADEAADAIVFLASNNSAFTTGQRLVIDGGFSS